MLRVVLEARPLEVLDHVDLPILQLLLELLAERVAELRQAAVGLPVGEEARADVVAGRLEVGVALPW